MKKNYIIVVIFLLVGSLVSKAQPTIPNNGFEQWIDTITPVGWGTTNLNFGFFTYAPVTRTTDKHSGSYAIKLQTKAIPMFGMLPGAAATGNIDVGTGISGGVPTNGMKPAAIGGYFKFNSINGDTAVIVVFLTKWNGTTRDTVGAGGIIVNSSVTSYVSFNEPINYELPQVPDTFIVICVSSAGYTPQENSTLYVDDLSFYGLLGERMPLTMFLQKVYPNPSDGIFTLSLADSKKHTVKVYNVLGQMVYEKDNVVDQLVIDLKDQPRGIYYIDVDNGEYRRTHKVIIQ